MTNNKTKVKSTVNDIGSRAWRMAQIDAYLDFLGYADGDSIFIRCIHPAEDHRPKAVSLTFKRCELPLTRLIRYESEGYNILITYNGGGHKKTEVTQRRAFVSESDTTTHEQQQAAWFTPQGANKHALNIRPSIRVDSGNKSLHLYWFLTRPVVNNAEADDLQSRIIGAMNSDESMLKAEQPLRLPGMKHPKTGRFTMLEQLDDDCSYQQYDPVDILKRTAHLPKPASVVLKKRVQAATSQVDTAHYTTYAMLMTEYVEPSRDMTRTFKATVARVSLASEGERNNTLASVAFELGLISATHEVNTLTYCTDVIDIMDTWPDKTKSYETFHRQFLNGVMTGQAERANGINAKKVELDDFYNFDKYKPVRFTAQYISDHVDLTKPGVHCVKSPKGTGKTFALTQTLNAPSVLSVTYRTSLEFAQTRPVTEGGLGLVRASAQDPGRRLVVCADSLHKVTDIRDIHTLIVDETSAVLHHLINSKGTTVRDDRTGKYDQLVSAIKYAHTVIFLDADLSTVELDFVKAIRDDVTMFINEYVPEPTKLLTPCSTANVLLDRFHLSIRSGQYCYMSTDSKKKAGLMYDDVKERHPDKRVLLISSETSGTAEVLAFMRDPNVECVKYDVVIASPTAQTGVDISVEHFQHVSMYGVNWSAIHYMNLLQGLARVRRNQHAFVFVDKPHSNPKAGEHGEVELDDVGPKEQHKDMGQLYCKQADRHAVLRQQTTMRNIIQTLQDKEGYKLTEVPPSEVSENWLERWKQCSDERKEAYARDILNAPIWSDDQDAAYEIKRYQQEPVTMEDVLAHHRLFLCRRLDGGNPYAFELTRDDVMFGIDGGIRTLKELNRALLWSADMTEALDFTDAYWDKRNEVFCIDRSRDAEKSALIRSVLLGGGIIVRHPQVDDDGIEWFILEAQPFTKASTEHLLAKLKGFEGYTTLIGKGDTIKTGLGLVRHCCEQLGLKLTDKQVRVQGKQVKQFTVDEEALEKVVNRYYSASKYPWQSVCRLAMDARSPHFKGEITQEQRDILTRVLAKGLDKGYFTGSLRFL